MVFLPFIRPVMSFSLPFRESQDIEFKEYSFVLLVSGLFLQHFFLVHDGSFRHSETSVTCQLFRHPWFDIHAWKLNKLSFFLKEFWTFFILQRLQNKLYKFSQYLLLALMFVQVGRSLLLEDTKVCGENPRVKADDHHIFSNTRIELRPQRC